MLDITNNLQPQLVIPKLYLIIMDPIGYKDANGGGLTNAPAGEVAVERYVHIDVHTSLEEARNTTLKEVENHPLTVKYLWRVVYESVWEAKKLEELFGKYSVAPIRVAPAPVTEEVVVDQNTEKNKLMVKIIKEKDITLLVENKASFSEAEMKYLEEMVKK